LIDSKKCSSAKTDFSLLIKTVASHQENSSFVCQLVLIKIGQGFFHIPSFYSLQFWLFSVNGQWDCKKKEIIECKSAIDYSFFGKISETTTFCVLHSRKLEFLGELSPEMQPNQCTFGIIFE